MYFCKDKCKGGMEAPTNEISLRHQLMWQQLKPSAIFRHGVLGDEEVTKSKLFDCLMNWYWVQGELDFLFS